MLLGALFLALGPLTPVNGSASAPSFTSTGSGQSAVLPPGATMYVGTGQPAGAPMQVSAIPAFRVPYLYHLFFEDLGTGYREDALLRIPPITADESAPLLVAFHSFGHSPYDVKQRSTFFQECFTRRWFIVAPLSATQASFSSLPSQINTEAVIQYVVDTEPIQEDRIYGVGFSMGGGSVTNYAARHVDPTKPMFAAVVNHSGGVSLRHAYWNLDLAGRQVLEFWFGLPDANPFLYQRSSVIDLDPITNLPVPGDVDLARNLTHIPMQHWYGNADTLVPFVPVQTQTLHQQIQLAGGISQVNVVQTSEHAWSVMDETMAMDFLEPFTLHLPTSARTLADEDGRYFHFDVEQDVPDAFTPFTWDVNVGLNRLKVIVTGNLQRITAHTEELGLDPGASMTFQIGATLDGTGDVVRFTGLSSIPSAVRRDGAATASWSWDPVLQTVSLVEVDSGLHTWTVTP